MESTRQLILKFLHKNHTSSASELSRVLQLTKADVRYHLKELQETKMVEKTVLHRPNQKGRPTQLFQIARQELPENYPALVNGLLAVLLEPDSNQESLDRLAVYFSRQIPPSRLLNQQLNRLAAYLTEHGYLARWEAYTNGPRILFRNCPYAQILPDHPEMCSLDVKIISAYLSLPFEQTARIDLQYAKIPACIFTLKNQTR